MAELKEIPFVRTRTGEMFGMKIVSIDLDKAVEGYEKYDFHAGTKCFINNLPFQLMCENGELSFEAEAICLTAHRRVPDNRMKIRSGEKIAIVCIENGNATAYEYTIPEKIRQQSFIVNERRR